MRKKERSGNRRAARQASASVKLVARRPGRPVEYPWSIWTNGEVHKVIRKKHFWCRVDSFMAGLRKRASKMNMKVVAYSSTDKDREVVFQFQK